ncbi:MAG: iron-containing redox enzyme family protein [Deltaproteobacteria bacterium]|nr:iron-containing redox enzyme family protein [Deltaproteobacteria bacterium]
MMSAQAASRSSNFARPAALRALPAARSADPAAFVRALTAEALAHRAVSHPYLAALAAGALPDVRWALADFARHYFAYSRHFPRYLTATISKLEDPAHRAALLDNLTEESGQYEPLELAELRAVGIRPEWIVGLPHPALFQRFAAAMGVDLAAHAPENEADQVVIWRELFLDTLVHGSAAEAVGALGLGTENIVSTIYLPFVKATRKIGLDSRDAVFFPLHTAVDDHHQATLQAIAIDLAATPEGRAGLRRGMLKALTLRTSYWDWMLARAQMPARADLVL